MSDRSSVRTYHGPPAAVEGVSLPLRKKPRRACASPARAAKPYMIVVSPSSDVTSNSTAAYDSSSSSESDGKEVHIKSTSNNGTDEVRKKGKESRSRKSKRKDAFEELVATYSIPITEHPYLHEALNTVGYPFDCYQEIMATFMKLRESAENPANSGTSDAGDVESGGGDAFDPYQYDIYKAFDGKEYQGWVIPNSKACVMKENKKVCVWGVKYCDNDQEQMEEHEILRYGRRKKGSQRLEAYTGRDYNGFEIEKSFNGKLYKGIVTDSPPHPSINNEGKAVWVWRVEYPEDEDMEDMEEKELLKYKYPRRVSPPCLGRSLQMLELFSGTYDVPIFHCLEG
jgi:hypothetical protein